MPIYCAQASPHFTPLRSPTSAVGLWESGTWALLNNECPLVPEGASRQFGRTRLHNVFGAKVMLAQG